MISDIATASYVQDALLNCQKDTNKTYDCVIKIFVCFTDPSVETVPFDTSNPKSFSAFICLDINNGRKLLITNKYL